MGPSARGKAFLTEAFSLVEQCQGIGGDDYYDQPVTHPMAEGKFLATAAAMARAKLLSPQRFASICNASAARLEASALRTQSGLAWGLNFNWSQRNISREEPFLVTCAIIALGLSHARNAGWKGGDDLLEGLCRALEKWPVVESAAGLVPAYSPSVSVPIVNSAALWAAAMVQTGRRGTADAGIVAVLKLIDQCFLIGCGWRYEPSSSKIDLVHGAYILRALIQLMDGVERDDDGVQILGTFRRANGFIDAANVVPRGKIFEQKPNGMFYISGEFAVLPHPRRARPWSLGEILSAISELARRGANQNYWRAVTRSTLLLTLESASSSQGEAGGEAPIPLLSERTPRLRHLAHVMEGCACALETLRTNAGADEVHGGEDLDISS